MNKTNPTRARMGSDPLLPWVKDTRLPADAGKTSKRSKHSKSELLINTKHLSNLGKPKSTRAGLKTGWTRATFIVREAHSDGIKSLAYWERRDIKDILDEALADFLKNKTIKPIPKGHMSN